MLPAGTRDGFLGLDLSLTGTGAAWTLDGHLTAATLSPHKDVRGVDRLTWFWLALDGTLNSIRPEWVVLEGPAHAAQYQAHQLGELHGIVKLKLAQRGVPFQVVAPSALKKFVTGKGNAPKELVLREVYRRWGFAVADNNQADAAALAMWLAGATA